MLLFAVFAASCDGGSSDSTSSKDSTKPSSTAKPKSGDTTTSAYVPVGAEAAVAEYLESQGIEYVGDCSTAELPRDEGKWCSTLLRGADSDAQKVYAVGPVGSKPEKIITVDRRGQATLTPGLQVDVVEGTVGDPRQLTAEELLNDAFIAANLLLDQQAGIGNGLSEIPGQPGAAPGTGGGGTGGGGTGGGGTPPPANGGQYPPEDEIVVDDPTPEPGGDVVFRGSGCEPNETLTVLWDGKVVGTVVADANGTFSGSLQIPPGSPPGPHILTVRGSQCELSVTITVGGGLASTGSSTDSSTTVLVGLAVLTLGLVLIVGSRRRRTGGSRAAVRAP